nr:mitofusin-2 like protein [Dugesia japonica]
MSTTDNTSKLDEANANYNNLYTELEIIEKSELSLLNECRKLDDLFPKLESSLNDLCRNEISKISVEQNRLKNIRETMKSNQMEIIFIGNVSCGKSKVVNCILEEEILQSSTGATTRCVVKIQGTKENKDFLKYDNKNIPFENRQELIDKLMDISTTLGDETVDNKELICVELTGQKGQLINDQTQLIDTPGYNNSENVKETIINQCQIADIVVYVMNYNFNEEEKKLLQNLTTQTSKLNMFVLVNKWDETDNDGEETTEKSKNSITNNVSSWLRKYNDKDVENAKEKIFFISAKEKMNFLINKKTTNEFRQNEFGRFIKEIKNYLSNPEESKYKRHKDDIANTNKFKEIKKRILNESGEIIEQRKNAIKNIEEINKKLNQNKIEIVNNLNKEKEAQIAKLSGFFNKFVSLVKTVTFSDSGENNFNIETVAEEYDKRLNELELNLESDLKNIAYKAISNKKVQFDLLTREMKYKFDLVGDVESNQTKIDDQSTDENDATKLPNTKYKKNTIHNEMENTFDEFLNTINDRIDNLLKKSTNLRDNLEKSLGNLETATEKLNKK